MCNISGFTIYFKGYKRECKKDCTGTFIMMVYNLVCKENLKYKLPRKKYRLPE